MEEEQVNQSQQQEDEIANLIEVLDEHRKTCEREGKYVEAEMAKNRIIELKLQDFNIKKQELIDNQ